VALCKGEIVGEYRVIEILGAGGMGAVYKVEHLITRRVEAMKVLSTGIGSAPEEIQSFEREIQLQARLRHPNIAAVFSAVRDGDVLALVMEYVEGESLRDVLARQRLSVEAAVAVLSDVLSALDCAHRNGVVHRDVSPANVILTASGAAKLTDFGLALDASSARAPGAGTPAGTAWYMSPEQVRGVDVIDARSDIYSAAAVLYEALAGRKLFDTEGAFAIMQCQVETAPARPGSLRSGIPAALDRAVAKALAKDPAARFQAATEFRDAVLDAVGRGRDAHAGRRRTALAIAVLAAVAACSAAMVRFDRVHRLAHPAAAHVEALRTIAPVPPPISPPPISPPIEAPPAPAPVRATRPRPPRREARVTPAPPLASPEAALGAVPLPVAPDVASLPPVAAPAALQTPAVPLQPPDAPKPPKSGNRFVKALGKINPFRKHVE
jgi:eukaryotic-like serine/threonine-protein kinase